MAVQAEPPEVEPGKDVTLKALYADPKGDGREITFFWILCSGLITPTSDISSGCEVIGMPQFLTENNGGHTYTIRIPSDIMKDADENELFTATAVLFMCAGGKLPEVDNLDLKNINELCEGGDGLLSFKSFYISNRDEAQRNTNPSISLLVFNNMELAPFNPLSDYNPTGEFVCETTSECLEGVEIQTYMTRDSFEIYMEERMGKPTEIDEGPYISWFADGGEFSVTRSRTASPPGPFEVNWSPPQKGGKFNLYVVAHDLRGGTSWKTYAIEASTYL